MIKNEDKTVKSIHDRDRKEGCRKWTTEQEISTQHGKLAVRDYEIPKKNVWFVNLCRYLLGGGEASFFANENYTGRVHFESHSSEWRMLSNFSFQLATSSFSVHKNKG